MRSRSQHVAAAFATGAILAASLAASELHPAPASAQCLPTIKYRGREYWGVRATTRVPIGRYVGRAGIPSCNDYVIPGQPPPQATETPVDAYRAGNVDPRIALRTRSPDALYLGGGFLPVLPSHPLHVAIFGSGPSPKPTACRRPTRLSGRTADSPILDAVSVSVGRHVGPFPPQPAAYPLTIYVKTTTTFSGTTRLHLPYLAPKSRIRVRGAFCYGSQNLFVARSITTVP